MTKMQEINIQDLLTPQEEWWCSSTPKDPPPKGDKRWYVPQAVTDGYADITTINQVRQEQEFLALPPFQVLMLREELNFKPDMSVKLRFQGLDPEIGMTIDDPQIIAGIWDEKTSRFISEKNITSGYLDLCQRFEKEMYIRDDPSALEGQMGGGLEGKY